MKSGPTLRWERLLLLVALLLGTALRFYHLDAQSFWNDEGNAARLAERSVALIIKGASADVHPPGYYLVLHVWRQLTGSSEYALRSFSAFCGVLTVALTAALGRQAGGTWTALGAAYGIAVHPLSVYYSQEARMYGLLGLMAAATLLLSTRLWSQRKIPKPRMVGLLVTLIVGSYTHYAFAFVVLGVNVAFAVLWLVHRPLRWRHLRTWVSLHFLAGLAFLYWLPYALRATGWAPPDLNTGRALVEMSRALLVGITLPAEAAPYVLPVAVLLLFLAIVTKSRASFVKWAALATTSLPVTLIAAFGIYRAAYLKFLIVAVTPLTILLALPLASNRRVTSTGRLIAGIGGILLLSLLPAQGLSLRHLYVDPDYARDDYRRIAAQIAANADPDDAIILSAPNQWEVFTYYYQGPITVYPAPYHPEIEKAETWVQEVLAAQHPELFVLYWGDRESDPHHRLERRLAQRTYKATERWITDVRLARYGTAPLPESPDVFINAMLGDALHLEGYSLVGTLFHPGEILPLTLFWYAEHVPDARYKVFVHVLDEEGNLVAQRDAEPVSGFRPVSNWSVGEVITDRHGILLPEDLKPGTYTLTTGMYRVDGTRLNVSIEGKEIGNVVRLQRFEVQPSLKGTPPQ